MPRRRRKENLDSLETLNVTAYNARGLLPLHNAVRRKSYQFVKALLEKGARVDAKTKRGQTALSFAIEKLRPINVLKLLLNHNADLNNVLADGRSAPWLATTLRTSEKRRARISNCILNHAIGSNTGWRANYYKLCQAIINNNLTLARDLINSVKDVDFKRQKSESPLQFAIYLQRFEIIELLLERGSNPNEVPQLRRKSALNWAITDREDALKIVDLLLRFGVDLNVFLEIDFGKESPVYRATRLRNVELMELLILHGAEVDGTAEIGSVETALHLASRTGFIEGVKLLVNYSANVETLDDFGLTPLVQALDHYDVTEFLAARSSPDGSALTRLDSNGKTILHYVADSKDVEIVKLILGLTVDRGIIDVNARENDGKVALHWVDRMENFESACANFVEFLKRGADLNIQDEKGNYPKHLCANNEIASRCLLDEYVQRLRVLGYKVKNDQITWGTCQTNLSQFYRQELNELKEQVVVWNPKLTLFHLLFADVRALVRYFANENMANFFARCKNDFESEYPYYGGIMNLQYRRGRERKKLTDDAWNNLTVVFDADMPGICSHLILRYLSRYQLKSFADEKFS